MSLAKSLWRNIDRIPPILYAMTGWGVTLGFSAIMTTEWMNDAIRVPLLLFVLLLVPLLLITSLIYATKLYRINRWYLFRIIQLYIILALVFANLFYILIVVADPTPIYEGIHLPWKWLGGTQGRRMYWDNVWKSAVDCIYYSFATITTSAYGDIKPIVWYTKMLANLEVLLGLGLVSIGIGRYFSEREKV